MAVVLLRKQAQLATAFQKRFSRSMQQLAVFSKKPVCSLATAAKLNVRNTVNPARASASSSRNVNFRDLEQRSIFSKSKAWAALFAAQAFLCLFTIRCPHYWERGGNPNLCSMRCANSRSDSAASLSSESVGYCESLYSSPISPGLMRVCKRFNQVWSFGGSCSLMKRGL